MRFLISDDHSIVRMGVRLMLESDYPDAIIDEAENGDEVVEKIKLNSYDLLILDFQMPNTEIFSLLGNLLARDARLKILIFSMASEKIYAGKLLKAGVKGFLSKEAKSPAILTAVNTLLRGQIYLDEKIWAGIPENITTYNNPFEGLSAKEMDILAFLILGKTTKEISTLANLQVSTVSTHKFRIFRKLNVSNVVELITLAKEYQI